jgi:ABC-type multidrug transport system fused ATPase/permease subunit
MSRFVTHRLGAVAAAEIILVIGKGQIVQNGSHAELMNDKNGLYFKMYDEQRGLYA